MGKQVQYMILDSSTAILYHINVAMEKVHISDM